MEMASGKHPGSFLLTCVAGMGELAQGHRASVSRRAPRYKSEVFGGVMTLWDWHNTENRTIRGTFIYLLLKHLLSHSGVGVSC